MLQINYGGLRMDRPDEVLGRTPRIKTGCGKLYATISLPDEPYSETLLRLGKSGGCPASFLDGIGRLISLTHAPDEIVIKAFSGIRCPSPCWSGGVEVLSCLDAVAKLLKPKQAHEKESAQGEE